MAHGISTLTFSGATGDQSLRLTSDADLLAFVGAFHFEVQIQWNAAVFEPPSGDTVSQLFTKVSGIVSESEQMEYMQGADPYIRMAPGRSMFSDVTLERVYHGVDSLYQWRLYVQRGNLAPLNVDLYMKRPDGTDVRHVTLINAWPSRWEMPEMDASASGPALERIVLTVEEVIEQPVF